MHILNLNKESLEPFSLNENTISTEGELYTFNFEGSKKLIKLLDFYETPYYNNKLKIILSLNNFRNVLPEELCIPEGLIQTNDFINGFYLPFIKGTNLKTILSSNEVSHNTKIEYLKLVGNLLETIKNIDFYLNDLHEDNFIITDGGKLKAVDLDSAVIGNTLPFASKYLTPFSLAARVSKYKVVNKKDAFGYIYPSNDTDLYCYMIMILNYLLGVRVSSYKIESFNKLLNELNDIGLDKELIDVFSLIISNKENINPVNLLDTITEKQFNKIRRLRK